MKTKIASFLFLVAVFYGCNRTGKESIVGQWSIVSILPLDSTSGTSGLEVAAIGWLNSVVDGGVIEFYENGDYEVKKESTSYEKGKYSVGEKEITITKPGSTEKSSLNFKNKNEVDIKSSTMALSLKRN